eukprot:CAMPEP_0173179202 /NCGR_PEP_ID=MMETSP1141-20130122/5978_1 /TAXON_ID=483371 /ORGANISM="non described non described, Strain CCMP2298" /LENGTH=410 /DNA_ID=CAMNT_0014101813 /DNA_START=217 /DNA_END=1446 /DNA_ORIENTATION=+
MPPLSVSSLLAVVCGVFLGVAITLQLERLLNGPPGYAGLGDSTPSTPSYMSPGGGLNSSWPSLPSGPSSQVRSERSWDARMNEIERRTKLGIPGAGAVGSAVAGTGAAQKSQTAKTDKRTKTPKTATEVATAGTPASVGTAGTAVLGKGNLGPGVPPPKALSGKALSAKALMALAQTQAQVLMAQAQALPLPVKGTGTVAGTGTGTGAVCPYDFKVYVYDLPPALPALAISLQARRNSSLHVCHKCILEQFALEYIVLDFFTQHCSRTHDPTQADFFYLPLVREAEFRLQIQSGIRHRQPSTAEKALLLLLEKNDSSGWHSAFNVTDKYWHRSGGADHIIVMPAPVTNLRHETSKRGFFHYMLHLHAPIFLCLEYSRSFVEEYPVCAREKNIVVPYPTIDPELYTGVLTK